MSVKDSQTLKGLQVRKARIESDMVQLRESSKAAQRAFSDAQSQLASVNAQIESMRSASKEIVVSEHAILRYLERVKGLDLDSIRKEIISEETSIMAKAMGNGSYPIHNGFKVVIKDMTVVSVV